MSLQKIFESARKLGVPVIVTDPAGREPLVILPLEQFEAMAGAGETPVPPAARHLPDVNVALAEMTAERLQSNVEEAVRQFGDEIPLEEGFYLEPVEDKETD